MKQGETPAGGAQWISEKSFCLFCFLMSFICIYFFSNSTQIFPLSDLFV